MNQELLRKLQRETKYYIIKSESLEEEIENKRVNILELEFHIRRLKKDLGRSLGILEALKYRDR